MLKNLINIRARYAETDQMGYVYHGNYAEYYEVGRVELLRQMGIRYKDLEEQGVLMPVTSMNIKFLRPARYDDLISICTSIKEFSTHSKRIKFYYELKNEQEKVLNIGEVVLAFVDKNSGKSIEVPKVIVEALEK